MSLFESKVDYKNGLIAVLLSDHFVREKDYLFKIQHNITLRLYPENEDIIQEIKDILKDKLDLTLALKAYKHTNRFEVVITEDEYKNLINEFDISPYILDYGYIFSYDVISSGRYYFMRVLPSSIQNYPKKREFLRMYPFDGIKDYLSYVHKLLSKGNLLYSPTMDW